MPADESLRLDHGQGAQDRRKPAVKLHKEPAIAVTQRDPTFDLASQDNDLMPQQHILGNEVALRPEGRRLKWPARTTAEQSSPQHRRFRRFKMTERGFRHTQDGILHPVDEFVLTFAVPLPGWSGSILSTILSRKPPGPRQRPRGGRLLINTGG